MIEVERFLKEMAAGAGNHRMATPDPRKSSHLGEKPRNLAVLVVDDESLIRWSLKAAFQERGHSVTTAGAGNEALAALVQAVQPFDVILLDYRLPDRHDLTLLEDVRRLSPRSVVFMMTAFADECIRTQASAHGARLVIDKPFQVTAVVALAESAAA